MIEFLHFQNFKAIRMAAIRLRRLTVIVGPNASGKSSVLQGLNLLVNLGRNSPWVTFAQDNAPGVLRTRGSDGDLALALRGRHGPEEVPEIQTSYGASVRFLQRPPQPNRGQWQCDIGLELTGKSSQFSLRNKVPDPQSESKPWHLTAVAKNPVWPLFAPSVLLNLDVAQLCEPSAVDEPVSSIGSKGTGLASVLAEMAATRPDDLEKLQSAVRSVVPGFQRLRLERATVTQTDVQNITVDDKSYSRLAKRDVWGYRLIVDMVGAPDIPASGVSEGTLLTIGLFSVLMNPERPKLLLLDNLERGLHPKALGDLVTQLRAILKRYPDLQMLATSHSPYLLDYLEPNEIRCSAIGPDGSAMFASLSDHPELERWKDAMRPGEFWSTVGEQWVTEIAKKQLAKQNKPKVKKKRKTAAKSRKKPADV